jgi:hypothetical protein
MCIKSPYPEKLNLDLCPSIPAFFYNSTHATVALRNASAIWQIVAKAFIKFCGENGELLPLKLSNIGKAIDISTVAFNTYTLTVIDRDIEMSGQ